MKRTLLFGFLMLYFASCSPKIVSVGNEDLSKYRNKYNYQRTELPEGQEAQVLDIPLEFDSTVQNSDLTAELDKLFDTRPLKPYKRIDKRDVPGYRIQIYRGRSRELASKARQRCYDLFSSKLTPYMTYSAPTYRVRVGDFLDRYEYAPYLKILKREFPRAIAVPATVRIIIQNDPPSYNYPRNNRNQDEGGKQ